MRVSKKSVVKIALSVGLTSLVGHRALALPMTVDDSTFEEHSALELQGGSEIPDSEAHISMGAAGYSSAQPHDLTVSTTTLEEGVTEARDAVAEPIGTALAAEAPTKMSLGVVPNEPDTEANSILGSAKPFASKQPVPSAEDGRPVEAISIPVDSTTSEVTSASRITSPDRNYRSAADSVPTQSSKLNRSSTDVSDSVAVTGENDATGIAGHALGESPADKIANLLSRNNIKQQDLKPIQHHIDHLSQLMAGSGRRSLLQKVSGVNKNPFDADGSSSDAAVGKVTSALNNSVENRTFTTWSRQGTVGVDISPWFAADAASNVGMPLIAAFGPEAIVTFTMKSYVSAGQDEENYLLSHNITTEIKVGVGVAGYAGLSAKTPLAGVGVDGGVGAETLYSVIFNDGTGVTFFTPRSNPDGSVNTPDNLIRIAHFIHEGGGASEILGKIADFNAPNVFMKITADRGDSSVTSGALFGRLRGNAGGLAGGGALGVLEVSHTASVLEHTESGDTVSSSKTTQNGLRFEGGILATANQTMDYKMDNGLYVGNASIHHPVSLGFSVGRVLTDSIQSSGQTSSRTQQFNNFQEFKAHLLNPDNGYADKVSGGSQLKSEYENMYGALVGESTGGENFLISSKLTAEASKQYNIHASASNPADAKSQISEILRSPESWEERNFSFRTSEPLPSNNTGFFRQKISNLVSRGSTGLIKLNFKSSATQTGPVLDTKAIDPSQGGLTVRGLLLGLGGKTAVRSTMK